MLYELRTYEAAPGKMGALNKRFSEHTLALFARHGIEVIGFWTNTVGGWSNELIYMLRFENMAARETAWAAFGADPDWQKAFTASEVDGPLTTRIRAEFLRPTNYSPLK